MEVSHAHLIQDEANVVRNLVWYNNASVSNVTDTFKELER